MVFHLSVSDNKSIQVSRTFLSILADHSNAVVWKVAILSPISKFPSFSPSLYESFQVRQSQLV